MPETCEFPQQSHWIFGSLISRHLHILENKFAGVSNLGYEHNVIDKIGATRVYPKQLTSSTSSKRQPTRKWVEKSTVPSQLLKIRVFKGPQHRSCVLLIDLFNANPRISSCFLPPIWKQMSNWIIPSKKIAVNIDHSSLKQPPRFPLATSWHIVGMLFFFPKWPFAAPLEDSRCPTSLRHMHRPPRSKPQQSRLLPPNHHEKSSSQHKWSMYCFRDSQENSPPKSIRAFQK